MLPDPLGLRLPTVHVLEVLLEVMAMKPRAPNKRQICRYFASGNSCYYGDACQFQHVLEVAGNSLVAPQYRETSNTGPGSSSKSGASPPLRSLSAGSKPIHQPPGMTMRAMIMKAIRWLQNSSLAVTRQESNYV